MAETGGMFNADLALDLLRNHIAALKAEIASLKMPEGPPNTLGEFVNRTLAMWEKAATDPVMKDVRFDIAAEILRNTYSVAEMTGRQ